MSLDSRSAALKALIAFRRKNARPDMVLSDLSKNKSLSDKDMSLSVKIVNGVLQNEMLCDYYISTCLDRPVSKLEPVVLDILRLSAYQLFFLERVPSHAIVSEAVSLTKTYSTKASGLVNAVLRKLSKNRGNPPEVIALEIRDKLAIKYSHPRWLVDKLVDYYGLETCEKILARDNCEPGITFQVNTLKTDIDGLIAKLHSDGIDIAEYGITGNSVKIRQSGDISKLSAFKEGLFYVQDDVARIAVKAAGVAPDMRVLDVCSAPGGKSFAAAIDMRNRGEIFSFDIHEKKLNLIRNGADRLGISIISCFSGDSRNTRSEFIDTADIVLADVPCSGIGVIRKKPEIRYKDYIELKNLPGIQLDILSASARYVKRGGVLLYSTCTILPEENQEVVYKFLSKNDSFILEGFEISDKFDASSGMAVILPHIADTDGFFICKMRRV